MKFCSVCGAETKEEETNGFNTETGKRNSRDVCSKNRCHSGHDERMQPFFSKGDWKCSRCGKIGWFYDGLI